MRTSLSYETWSMPRTSFRKGSTFLWAQNAIQCFQLDFSRVAGRGRLEQLHQPEREHVGLAFGESNAAGG